MPEAPDWSSVSEHYAAARPTYPAELFDWLASCVVRRETAWDTATGTGQAAIGLAPHFTRVIATDVSANQLRHATQHPRIEYRVASAEASGLADGSVDLAVAAAAIHWFDLEKFYDEVRRVVRPGGMAAAWTYHVADVGPRLDRVLWPFYREVVGPYFAAGARMVDAHYAAITLPGKELAAPEFHATVRWTADDVFKFIRTWSGTQAYIAATKTDPVERIAGAVREIFGGEPVLELKFPLYLRAAKACGMVSPMISP